MSGEKSTSKADTLVKVVLVFFISLLSFSVGTFVGKQVSDSDHRRMALEGESKGERGVASVEGEVEGDEHGKISEKEVESLTEEFVNKEKGTADHEEAEEGHGEKTAEAKHDKADAAGYKTYARGKVAKSEEGKGEHNEHETQGDKSAEHNAKNDHGTKAPKADGAHKVAEKLAHGEAPSDGAKEQRKPASTLPSVANSAVGKYTIQVASYAQENEAKTHAADLKGKGWNAFYFPAAVKGHTWYRVSVGLFSNTKSADEFRAQFMKEAGTKSAIVQKVVQ